MGKRAWLYRPSFKRDYRTLSEIFHCTEKHPYYVNKLCSLLWQRSSVPSQEDTEKIWLQYISENKSGIERELDLLSVNQRKLLMQLSNEDFVNEPFSKAHAMGWNMSATSIHRAMESLLKRDYVFLEDGKYRILDPLIKGVLQLN